MGTEDTISALQLNVRLCGVSPPVTRRLVITEQASLAQLHATLQVAFGWSYEHLYVFQIRGWQFGDPACCDMPALSDAAALKRLAPDELPDAVRPLGPG